MALVAGLLQKTMGGTLCTHFDQHPRFKCAHLRTVFGFIEFASMPRLSVAWRDVGTTQTFASMHAHSHGYIAKSCTNRPRKDDCKL